MFKNENSLRINGRIFFISLIFLSSISTFFYWKYLSKKDSDRFTLNSKIPNKEQTKGYISSDTCRSCHPAEYASWYGTYHRTMTQVAGDDSVMGRFDGSEIDSRGLKYQIFKKSDQYWAKVPDPEIIMKTVETGRRINDYTYQIRTNDVLTMLDLRSVPRVEKRVVMTTGSHHYQTYWIDGSVSNQVDRINESKYGNLLQTLPLVYLPKEDKWIPREDAFMRAPSSKRMISQWNHHCIKCHSTNGNPGLKGSNKFETEVAEFGISCESCHGAAEEHVKHYQSPIARYAKHFGDKSINAEHIKNPAKLDHKLSSQICGQCHGVYIYKDAEVGMEYARNGPMYRPGNNIHDYRYFIQHPESSGSKINLDELKKNRGFFRERWWDDGTILAGGREFTAMRVSACYTKEKEGMNNISCLDCHSMHHSEPKDQLRQDMVGNQSCVQCHQEDKYTTEIKLHTHHEVDSSGSSCINCHMPHTSYALLGALRSHQIQSPSAFRSIKHGVPNACNLCHLDKTLEWTQKQLSVRYNHPIYPLEDDQRNISAWVLWLLKGHAAQRAIAAWHGGWEPAKAASGTDWLPPYLISLLDDPYGVVRYIAYKSLQSQESYANFEYDYLSGNSEIERKSKEAMSMWLAEKREPSNIKNMKQILILDDGAIDREEVNRLLSKRDNRPVNIKE